MIDRATDFNMPQKLSAMSRSSVYSNWDIHRLQQIFKWTVYFLLIVNFGCYIADDLTRAILTQTRESSIFQWLREFATTIDESAWFILIIMLELETYVLEDRHFTKRVRLALHSARLFCCLMIAYTIVTYGQYAVNIIPNVPVQDASNLCELSDRSHFFTSNLEYTEITPENCAQLSSDSSFFLLVEENIVTDTAGLALERQLAWVDFAEASLWIVIIALIEVVVRIQERGIGHGALISGLNWIKNFAYVAILGLGVWWASLGHWLYLWDEILWVGGFTAIEMNLSEWRDEIDEQNELEGAEDVAGSM